MTAHVAGMFALAPVTGRPGGYVGATADGVAGCSAADAGQVPLAGLDAGVGTVLPAMFLLGYGWNACFVAGLHHAVARAAAERARPRPEGRG